MSTKDARDLLTVLKDELAFVDKGGYRNTSEHAWRPLFIFQDSPTCLNRDVAKTPRPCSDCVLMRLVPENHRDKRIPCRHIPLNELGETIDSFYRMGTRDELESALRRWLRSTIHRLEQEKAMLPDNSCPSQIHVHCKATTIPDREQEKAAKPDESCPTEIHVRANAATILRPEQEDAAQPDESCPTEIHVRAKSVCAA